MDYFEDLIAWIKASRPTKKTIANKKIALCKVHGMRRIPTDIEVLLHATNEEFHHIKQFLKTKPTRTGSGVAVVATMTAPFACPHGSCSYCPGGPKSAFGDTPKSYTGKEPSTMRGIRHDYDPYSIIFNRLEQYIVMGQNPDKVEQIIMGGTFPSFPREYQESFVRSSFKAYNDFSRLFFPGGELDLASFKEFFELPGNVGDSRRAKSIKEKILAQKALNEKTLEEEQVANEKAVIRCVGLTVETRPDWGRQEHGLELLRLGATRVELGVQTTDDEVLRSVNRGHDDAETRMSVAELRDLGFKLNFHVMPGLPGTDGKRVSKDHDVRMLKMLFKDADYRPDMLKVYPCMVMPGTLLEEKYREGIFVPLTAKEAADIIVSMKQEIPEWCRIMRVQRDIPTNATVAGVERTNLRQEVLALARERGVRCRCIRCREVGSAIIHEEPRLEVQEYEASGGKEFFISVEADDKLLGFIRLRFPKRSLHPAITAGTAIIRELHVYGAAVMIGAASVLETQHKGLGKRLVAEAESLAKNHDKRKMAIISGVGVREYYRRLGYRREGPYMTREL